MTPSCKWPIARFRYFKLLRLATEKHGKGGYSTVIYEEAPPCQKRYPLRLHLLALLGLFTEPNDRFPTLSYTVIFSNKQPHSNERLPLNNSLWTCSLSGQRVKKSRGGSLPSSCDFFTAPSPNTEHVHRLPNKRPPLSQNIKLALPPPLKSKHSSALPLNFLNSRAIRKTSSYCHIIFNFLGFD